MASHPSARKTSQELNKKSTKSASNKDKPQKPVKKCVRVDSNPRHPTQEFIEKSENAFKRLETRIGDRFRAQISSLFENEDFADISIKRGKFNKRVHSCVLLTRIPELFTELLTLNLNRNAFNPKTREYIVKIPQEIKESELKILLQKIYSEYSAEDMEKEEKNLISKIEIFNKDFIPVVEEVIESKKKMTNDKHMDSSGEYPLHSDIQSDEERVESEDLESIDDINEDNIDLELSANGQLVRSGTFEVLTSIYFDDKYDIKDSDKKLEKEIKERDLTKTNEQIIEEKQNQSKDSEKQMTESLDEKSMETSQNPMETSKNSMFSLFIDFNQTSDDLKDNQRPKTTTDDKRKGFDFIPLDNSSDVSLGVPQNLRRSRRSADAILLRTRASTSPKTETVETIEDIPLLPMTPILRQKPVNDPKEDIRGKSYKNRKFCSSRAPESHCLSSSDSFSEAFNECLNLSINSSTKNSYESDSIDIYDENECKDELICDSDEQLSEDGNDWSSDWDANDPQKLRNLKSCSKLGEDLLKMFVQQINTDITIKVSDREIRAHKCILTARSRYFDAMLKGNWMESGTNCVDLQGFTFNSVYFALCHIYSGCLTLPPKLDLSELALLSDVLSMDSLKDIVVHELMVNRCHFFHSPCGDECVVGVVKCLKLCSRSGLNDLYNKCVNWTSKHFTRVWVNRAFASLKPPLLEECLQTRVKQLLSENVLKTILDCERLITSTPRVKWSEPVFALLAKLIDRCCSHVADNYNDVITSKHFMSLGRGNSWDISNLEQTLLAAMTKLSPDISCKALIELNRILLLEEKEQMSDGFSYGPFNDLFGQLVAKMHKYCERYMIQNANRVVNCQAWALLSKEVQQKIRDGAVIVFEFEKPTAAPPKLSSRFVVKVKKTNNSSNCEKSCDGLAKGVVSKVKRNSSAKQNLDKLRQKAVIPDHHIYDSVPFENISSNITKKPETRKTERVSNKALSLHLNSSKSEEKIAKVSPFSVKTQNSCELIPSEEQSTVDLMAEIDAETNLVTYCLQEAELLEQELTRKFHKTNIRSTGVENRASISSTSGADSQTHHQNIKSAKSHTKDDNPRRMSSKSHTTSMSRVRALPKSPKTPNQRK